MTAVEELDALQGQIRRVVAAGSYAEAGALLCRHSICLEAAVRSLPYGDGRLRELESRSQGFLEWVRRMVLAGRTHAAEQARRLPQVSRYRTPDAGRAPRLQLEG